MKKIVSFVLIAVLSLSLLAGCSKSGDDKKIIGIELHSGKNRIVRRIFASLGYDVIKLDRVSFAGLTKKNLPRGNYRFLSEQEVSFLKMLKAN